MKTKIILSFFIVFTLVSCNHSPRKSGHNTDMPKALENEGELKVYSSRSWDDLVESLYKELADQTPELKELEGKLEMLAKSKIDSLEVFATYNEKNQSYYSAANVHLEQIKDSVLRTKMKSLIEASLTKYNVRIEEHTELMNLIDANTINLNDLHTVLKITKTLPMIEKYQAGKLPTKNSLKGFTKQLDEAMQMVDTLVKKQNSTSLTFCV